MEIIETLKHHRTLLKGHYKAIKNVDNRLTQDYKTHEERASRIRALIDSGKIMEHIGLRINAHRHGRIRSYDNPIDAELEGLRKYVDTIEEAHNILIDYLHELSGMKDILIFFHDKVGHDYGNKIAAPLLLEADTLRHHIESENKHVREDELLLKNLTETIARERSALSMIFLHDNDHTITNKQPPISLMRERFNNTDLNLRRIASRVHSHNTHLEGHILSYVRELNAVIRDYESIMHSYRNYKKAA